LKSIDPKSLQTTLEEIGDLDPLTELRADNSARILFARATPTDHQKIETLKEQLDSDTMETLVIELRKHPADAVAGTLRDLFAPKKEETSENNQRYESWNPYRSMESQPKEKKPISDLRVDADVENNRLFVRGSAESLQ